MQITLAAPRGDPPMRACKLSTLALTALAGGMPWLLACAAALRPAGGCRSPPRRPSGRGRRLPNDRLLVLLVSGFGTPPELAERTSGRNRELLMRDQP